MDNEDFSPSQRVRLAPNPVLPDGSEVCGSSTTYGQIFSCNLVDHLGKLALSLKDLATMIPGGLATAFDARQRLLMWEAHNLGNAFAALAGDPAAQQRLATEIQVQMETWVNVGIMSRDALTAVGGSIAGLVREGDRVYSTGDYEAMTAFAGRFLGENPDLGLAALAKIRGLRAIAAATIVDATVRDGATLVAREATEAAGRKAAEELGPKIRKEIDNGRNPAESGILKGGEDVTDIPELYQRCVRRPRRSTCKRALDIAQDENVLIAFRGRAADLAEPASTVRWPGSSRWTSRPRCINAIDITYLGYPQETFGRSA